jgi:hypothetical protein
MFCTAALCLSATAHASGRLPIPPASEEFTSHAACIAALEAHYREDQKQATQKSAGVGGKMPEVELTTDGVTRLAEDNARYGATIWHHHLRIRDDLQQTETGHNYEYRLRECEGKIMRITGEDDYTSSTFEPLPVAGGQTNNNQR